MNKLILSASEAHDKARFNTPTARLVFRLMDEIVKACDEGHFHMAYECHCETNYTIHQAEKELRELGYSVTLIKRPGYDVIVEMVVSWG